MLATEILIGFRPKIEKHCFYALTDFFLFLKEKRSEVARSRQGVTGSFGRIYLYNSLKFNVIELE